MRNFKIIPEPALNTLAFMQDPLFRAIVEEAPDGIFFLHPGSFEILDCNAKAMQLFQVQDKAELIGCQSFSLYDSEPVEFSKNQFIETVNTGREYSQELAFRSLKGNVFWGKTSLRKVETLNGSCIVFRVRMVVDYMNTAEMLSSMTRKTSRVTGHDFFGVLTETLAKCFGISTAMIAKINDSCQEASVIHGWHQGLTLGNLCINLEKSPSANVLKGYTTYYPCNLQDMFPDDPLIRQLELVSYLGTPVFNAKGNVQGLLMLFDGKCMEEIPNSRYILSLFASRCSAELERMETEANYQQQIRSLEAKLGSKIR
jgi:PAS domain S-box-containing protein